MQLSWYLILGFAFSICHTGLALAQSIGFTVYPQQVITGQSYTVSWSSNNQPVTITLLKNGVRQDVLTTSDGSTSTFQWRVEDDYSGGTDYTLQLNSGSTSIAQPVLMIEDEDGVVVSGSTVLSPSPTSMVTSATAISGIITSTTNPTPSSTIGLISTSSSSSTVGPTSVPDGGPAQSPAGLHGGAIAGIVIAVLVALALIIAGVWFYRRRKMSKVPRDPDPIGSFLALGKRGGASKRIAKGTSPEVRDEEKSAATDEDDVLLIPNRPELHAASHIPWNELSESPRPSVINGVFEADSRPVMYELPTESARHVS